MRTLLWPCLLAVLAAPGALAQAAPAPGPAKDATPAPADAAAPDEAAPDETPGPAPAAPVDEPAAEAAPAEDAPAEKPPAEDVPAEGAPADDQADADPDPDPAEAAAVPVLSPAAAADVRTLRALEGRLSMGEPLNDAERTFLVDKAGPGPAAVRGLAMAILPWLGAGIAFEPLMAGATADEPEVRAMALSGLIAVARQMREDQKQRAGTLASGALDDPSNEVACEGGRLFAALDPQGAVAAIEARADAASDVRYGCWRQLASLPERDIVVARPRLPEKPVPVAPGPAGVKPQTDIDGEGSWAGAGVFIGTAAATGFMLGGLMPRSFIQPRDTLTYTRRQTKFAREEPSLVLGVAAAGLSGAAFGGAAFGLNWLVGDMDFAPAAGTTMMTLAGASLGMGIGLTTGLSEPWGGMTLAGTTLLGLGAGTAMGYLLPPSFNDLTLIATTAMHFALAGGLLAFVIVPVGVDFVLPDVLNNVLRLDFAVGSGLATGAAGAAVGLAVSPFIDISHGRMLAASGAALAAASTGLGLTYLFLPTGVVIRGRIASGVGLALGAVASAATFVLLPDSWARIFEHARTSKEPGAVAIEDGEIKAGLPALWTRPSQAPGVEDVAWGINLVSGRF